MDRPASLLMTMATMAATAALVGMRMGANNLYTRFSLLVPEKDGHFAIEIKILLTIDFEFPEEVLSDSCPAIVSLKCDRHVVVFARRWQIHRDAAHHSDLDAPLLVLRDDALQVVVAQLKVRVGEPTQRLWALHDLLLVRPQELRQHVLLHILVAEMLDLIARKVSGTTSSTA